jgi:ureidoglycolate hydrolase
MDDTLLEIRSYDGNGYKPLINFGEWRVAILRYLDDLQPDRIDSMERHTETDEVFVLLHGRGVLIVGGNGAQVDGVYPHAMESGKIYNVKKSAWHTILLNREASVLIVENGDTGAQNSEFASLSEERRGEIMKIARREGFAE